MTAPQTEHQRLLREARTALVENHPNDFRITGRAAEIAREKGVPLESIRTHYLVRAYEILIKQLAD